MTAREIAVLITVGAAMAAAGCGKTQEQAPVDKRRADADREVRGRYGKGLDELPTVKLVAISPNNTDIEREYEDAFSLHHAVQFGQQVDIDWRDVGGGSSAILRYLENVYSTSDRSGIDVVWGGGEDNFVRLRADGILHKMTISADVLDNVPAMLGGVKLYDGEHRWCGSAVSGFGFLYNKPLLERLGRQLPALWEDLGDGRFYDLVGLADPTQSGSAANNYEMIVQSGKEWPAGWAKLLSILGNAKKFYAGAGDAADAVPSGEVAVAACIDFYGTIRVSKYPDTLVYVSPKGQTTFTPDPIAILKNPPSPELAQRFVDFVLSVEGQAMWALPAGSPGGPVRSQLGRQPVRKDVYEKYAGRLPPAIVNPYTVGQGMQVDVQLWSASFEVLKQLVGAAAVRNRNGLRAAKKTLIDTGFEPQRLAEFIALPENVSSRDKLDDVARQLRDDKQAEIVTSGWVEFFRQKYERVSK